MSWCKFSGMLVRAVSLRLAPRIQTLWRHLPPLHGRHPEADSCSTDQFPGSNTHPAVVSNHFPKVITWFNSARPRPRRLTAEIRDQAVPAKARRGNRERHIPQWVELVVVNHAWKHFVWMYREVAGTSQLSVHYYQ